VEAKELAARRITGGVPTWARIIPDPPVSLRHFPGPRLPEREDEFYDWYASSIRRAVWSKESITYAFVNVGECEKTELRLSAYTQVQVQDLDGKTWEIDVCGHINVKRENKTQITDLKLQPASGHFYIVSLVGFDLPEHMFSAIQNDHVDLEARRLIFEALLNDPAATALQALRQCKRGRLADMCGTRAAKGKAPRLVDQTAARAETVEGEEEDEW